MEDLRRTTLQKQIDRSKKIFKYTNILKANWWKIGLGIVVVFILIFPNLVGEFIGWWYTKFNDELLKNIIK